MAQQTLIPIAKPLSNFASLESSGLIGYVGYGGLYTNDRNAYQCVDGTTPNTNSFMTAGYELDSAGNYSPIGANTIREGEVSQIRMSFNTNTFGIIAQSGYLVFDIGLKHPTLDGYLDKVLMFGIGNIISFYGSHGAFSGLSPSITRHSIPLSFNYSNAQAMYYNQSTPIIQFVFKQPSGIGLGEYSYPYIDKETTGINLYTARLIVFGESPIYDNSSLFMQCPEPISSGNSLYLSGPLPYSVQNTLYIAGQYPSGITNLYTQGPLLSDNLPSGTTLFIEGHENTETGIPLFIEGHQSYYSGCDLYLEGGKINDNITLFLGGLDATDVNNNMDLVIWTDGAEGSGYSNKFTTLFIESAARDVSGIPLFIEGGNFDTRSGDVPLYLNNQGSGIGSTNLFLRNHTTTLSGVTSLFVTNFVNVSGNPTLFIEGPASGDILQTTPLYLKAIDASYYNTVSGRRPLPMTLWNNQQDKTRSINLYIGQSTSSSGNIPLFIEGGGIDDRTKFADLYLHNRVESSGDIPLSLLTGVNIKSIPLVVTGLDPEKDNSGIPLFIYSANGSGIFAGNELFLQADTFGNTIPLFMKVIEVGYPTSNIPLYINNDNESKMSMSVFLESTRWTSGTQNLFINGLGLQPGASVLRDDITMFLARPNDSDGYSMYMHLAAPSGESQIIPMVLEGGTYSQLVNTLFLPEAKGKETGGMNIFTHGF